MQARPVRPRNRIFVRAQSFFLLAVTGIALAQDPFAVHVRNTEPLTPEQQLKTFHLPPGFEIQLVAADPEIGKPINMAFDARGRLWVSQSREYPYAAPTNRAGRDEIKVLSNFAPNGRARKVTTFADELNIPIGLLPYRDGVLALSIPNIYYFADTNHDGRADSRKVVLGRFGFEKDTHGLTSSFRRGFDGWIYADHGFNNDSTLTAKDGSTITMNSGNTYRFLPEGERVEQFSWGQVNPFGLMFDPLGDLWASDCHSKPVYMLVRNGRYPSFGKEHDGLGFAPDICKHQHGSTAIAGMVYYDATNFPAEYHGHTFVGNVTTCRINRDSYIEHGSTRIAHEEADFLRCDDPWFRPVDLQLGPDGALYVADFYNRIVAHYEVKLDHPGRDRERGRIWRIVYTGKDTKHPLKRLPSPEAVDLTQASASKLIKELGNPNINNRMHAMNQLTDRIGQSAVRSLEKMVSNKRTGADQKVHGLWTLHRLNALKSELLMAAAKDTNRTVRVHAMRILSESFRETGVLPEPYRQAVFDGLKDRDAYVQRAAADALAEHAHSTEHGDYEPIQRLMELRRQISPQDSQLMYVCRRALRNHLAALGAFPHLETLSLGEADARAMADIALAVPGEQPASFILKHVKKYPENRERMTTLLRHATRYAPDAQLDEFAELIRDKFADDVDSRFAFFKAMQEGVAQRGGKLTESMRKWAAELVENLLAPVDKTNSVWVTAQVREGAPASPWILQQRKSAQGRQTTFLSSLSPNGETLTGMLRCQPFTIPPKLSFFIAGHDDAPDKPLPGKNFIRLVAADTREALTNAPPPRNDIAQKVVWDLSAHAGKQGWLEIVDGNDGTGFAWLAVGRFEPLVVPLPTFDPNQQNKRRSTAAEFARTVPLPQFAPRFAELFNNPAQDEDFRAASAQTIVALDSQTYIPIVAATLADTNQPATFREQLALILAEQNSPVAREAVLATMAKASQRWQIKLALQMAGNAAGAEALLASTEEKKLSPQVIADRGVKERLTTAKLPKFEERFAALTKGLTPVSEELQKQIDERRVAYNQVHASSDRGRAVFEKACVICHQLDGKGAVIGPQLDGVGNRGLERIIEDVLDPSRNIDPAFQPSLVTLKDDTSITGLQRREEGEVLVFVDTQGKEITVQKKEIAEKRESQLSLMPSNFADVLTKEEFSDLMAFLLSHGGAK